MKTRVPDPDHNRQRRTNNELMHVPDVIVSVIITFLKSSRQLRKCPLESGAISKAGNHPEKRRPVSDKIIRVPRPRGQYNYFINKYERGSRPRRIYIYIYFLWKLYNEQIYTPTDFNHADEPIIYTTANHFAQLTNLVVQPRLRLPPTLLRPTATYVYNAQGCPQQAPGHQGNCDTRPASKSRPAGPSSPLIDRLRYLEQYFYDLILTHATNLCNRNPNRNLPPVKHIAVHRASSPPSPSSPLPSGGPQPGGRPWPSAPLSGPLLSGSAFGVWISLTAGYAVFHTTKPP